MSIDRRFAIIIGINDYDKNPLKCCVKDALSVADILEKKCRFQNEDIFVIKSDLDNPIRDISGHFYEAIKKITKLLKPSIDSIFFYFELFLF